MKTKLKIIFGVGANLMVACFTHAQNGFNTNVEETTYARQRWLQVRQQMLESPLRAIDFVGMKVENFQDQKLGKVSDLAVNLEAGRVIQVLVSSGGFAGIEASLTPVPPAKLNFDIANNVLKLDVSPNKFRDAPKFDLSKWGELNESNQVGAIYAYYNEPAFASLTAAESAEPTGQRAMDKLQNDEATQRARQELSALFQTNAIFQESKIIGCTVENSQSQPVGKVEDLILDLPSSQVLAVVAAPGNESELGADLKTYSPSEFHTDTVNGNLMLNGSQEIISSEGASAYPANNNDQTGDHGEINDNGNGSLTPLNQGNSPSDINTSALIRREIMTDRNVSIDGQNIKIITQNGHVTLRGQVASANEKQWVEKIASRVAQPANVSDQLVIAQTPSTTVRN